MFAAAIVACCIAAPPAQAKAREWSPCKLIVQLKDKRIDESSGICASRTKDGIYYTHNDSGDTARFFRFDLTGKILGVYNVTNAFPAVDWEDIASETLEGKPYIFCGDIGDNNSVRKEIYVYRVPEPVRSGDQSVRADRIYELTYPDGAHNAETLMVDAKSGALYIVTKTSKGPSEVFALPTPGPSGSYVLKKVGEIQVSSPISLGRLITGGDISPDAKHVLIRTYLCAYEYEVPARFDDWVKEKAKFIKTNFEFQGEGICYSRDGRALLTTSEGVPCPVSEAKLR